MRPLASLIGILVLTNACSSSPAPEEDEETKDELVMGGRFTNPIPPGVYDGAGATPGTIEIDTTMTAVRVRLFGRERCEDVADVRDGKVILSSGTFPCEADVVLTPVTGGFTAKGAYLPAHRETVSLSGTFALRQRNALSGKYVSPSGMRFEVLGSSDDAITVRFVDGQTFTAKSGPTKTTFDAEIGSCVLSLLTKKDAAMSIAMAPRSDCGNLGLRYGIDSFTKTP